MDARPLVSVVIPVHNAAEWIRETLNSVSAQTYPSIEVVLVDDGSTDATPEILSSYGDRVRVIANKTNQGVSVSRNIAIEAAKGAYIAFLDHDDLWHPQKIEKQM